ncbi:F-box/WD repeat-containing protein 9 [Astyanax mexicanus]|uniref:F-box/WD repeat-containing protein 9 n=1 Tax=Astyanax mexicanus TaxID=7994 RepID=UPI0020CABDF8|nr:F-box/WD repeat-containing protein 9 [Astyanax mexicanus]XP_022520725.2 F-box/WD repeat-containing protein 9 [Astyanax mexicanus]
MSVPQVTLEEEEKDRGRNGVLEESPSLKTDAPLSNQLGLNLEPPLDPPETSPSPSGLLSLPWEVVASIASHLPAQCIINVLPQVCRALGEVGEDTSAWQLRAHRLTGPKASFPVGPREQFDWPTACLEMEQLIERWLEQEEWAQRQRALQQEEAEREQEMDEDMDGADDGEDGANREDGAHGEAAAMRNGAVREAAREPDGAEEDMRPDAVRAFQEDGENPLEIRIEEEQRDNEDEGIENGLAEGGENHQDPPDTAGLGGDREQNNGYLDDMMDEGIDEGEVSKPQPPRSPSPPLALEHITLPSGHIADVNSVLLVGGEGTVCASGSRDRNVNLWDLRRGPRGELRRTLCGRGLFSTHRGWVWCLAASGSLLASGSFDSTVRLWDLEAGGAERGLIRSRAAVLCLSCQNHMLLAGSHDQKISIYDTRAAEPLVKSLGLHGDAVLCLASDDQYILSGSKDNTVAVYDCRAGRLLKKIQLKSYLLSMSYSGREVWAGDNHGLVHTFSLNEGLFKSVAQFNVGHSSLVTGVHHSPGTLYTCSSDRTIKVHLPCAPPKTLCTLHHQAGVNGLSVEAGVLAIASGDMNVEVWRPRQ